MKTLTPAERRARRAQAHALHPVVIIGQHGLTPAVLHEVDVALLAHELIKIRVFSDDRAAREVLLERICNELDAAPVQHLGKVLIVYRQAPEAKKEVPEARPKRAPKSKGPAPRRRAPATAKGPFEPGRRVTRSRATAEILDEGGPRRRRPGDPGEQSTASQDRRRRAETGAKSAGAGHDQRRRRAQPAAAPVAAKSAPRRRRTP